MQSHPNIIPVAHHACECGKKTSYKLGIVKARRQDRDDLRNGTIERKGIYIYFTLTFPAHAYSPLHKPYAFAICNYHALCIGLMSEPLQGRLRLSRDEIVIQSVCVFHLQELKVG